GRNLAARPSPASSLSPARWQALDPSSSALRASPAILPCRFVVFIDGAGSRDQRSGRDPPAWIAQSHSSEWIIPVTESGLDATAWPRGKILVGGTISLQTVNSIRLPNENPKIDRGSLPCSDPPH